MLSNNMAKMASSLNNNLVIPIPTSKNSKNIFAYLFLHMYLDNLAYEILNYRLTKKHLKSIFIWGKPQGGDHNNYIIGWCAMCTFEIRTHYLLRHHLECQSCPSRYIEISADHWYNLFFTTELKKENKSLLKKKSYFHPPLTCFNLASRYAMKSPR